MHTPGDIVVHFPWARVLHIGDLFGWGLFMQRRWDQLSIDRTQQVLARILDFGAEHLICGHGPFPTPHHIKRQLDYYNTMLERIAGLREEGRSVSEVKKELPPPEDMRDWWRFVDWKHAHNIEAAYSGL